MLEEGVSNHRHERMTVEALPGPTLEVIETEFLFQLWWACSQIHRALMVAAKARRPVFAGRLAR